MKAKQLGLNGWLLTQTERQDEVGVLAREFSEVVAFWKAGNREAFHRWRQKILWDDTAFNQAQREWDIERFGPPGSLERRRNLIAMFKAASDRDRRERSS